ncbi:MAG: hypothetical protein PF484_10610 [Bacteroidales bacterium]|jgi:hypothetical protein|nr:hypothetical protein [Bacteroidales bacterium]
MSIAPQQDFGITMQAWADIVIDIWEDKTEALGINDSYQLLDSFMNTVVVDANGNPEKIEFAFNYYGKFVDMGVGGNISISDIGSAVTSKRRPKAWYSKTFFSQVKKLGEILASKYAKRAALIIIENTDDNALKWGGTNV